MRTALYTGDAALGFYPPDLSEAWASPAPMFQNIPERATMLAERSPI
jgi:hypothetical protein